MKLKVFVAAWQEKSHVPLAVLGLIYLAAYSVQVLNPTNIAKLTNE